MSANETQVNRTGVYQMNNRNLKHVVINNRKEDIMAETSDGKKKVYVHPHTKDDGTKVKTRYRSTPNTNSGKKK